MKGYFGFACHPIERNDRQLMHSDRTSKKDRNFSERVQFVVRKKVGQALVGRPVQNESMSSFLAVVSGKKEDCLVEIRVT